MPKKTKPSYISVREVLEQFDLKKYKNWLRNFNKTTYKHFMNLNEETQMGCMCKMICDRTDMLSTEAHKKAVLWLKDHNMKGRLF